MRIFTQEVINNTLTGSKEEYSPQSTYDLLGGVEKLALHVRATRVSSGTPDLVIKLYHSNDGQDWKVRQTFDAIDLSTTEEVTAMLSDDSTSGAFVRVSAVMSGASSGDTVDVKVIACGRAEQNY